MTTIRANKFNAAGRLAGYGRIDADAVEAVLDRPNAAHGFGKKRRRNTASERSIA